MAQRNVTTDATALVPAIVNPQGGGSAQTLAVTTQKANAAYKPSVETGNLVGNGANIWFGNEATFTTLVKQPNTVYFITDETGLSLKIYIGSTPIFGSPIAESPGGVSELRLSNAAVGTTFHVQSQYPEQSGAFRIMEATDYPAAYLAADGGIPKDDGMDVILLDNGNIALRLFTPVAKAAGFLDHESVLYNASNPLSLGRAEGARPGGDITTTMRVLAARHRTLAPAKQLYLKFPNTEIPESNPTFCDTVLLTDYDTVHIKEGTGNVAVKLGPVVFEEFTAWESMGSNRWRCPSSGPIQRFFSKSPISGNTDEVVSWGRAVAETTQINFGTSSWNSNYQRWTRVQTGSQWHVWCYAPSNPHTYYGRTYGTTHHMAIMWFFDDFLEVIIGGDNHRVTFLGAMQTEHRFSHESEMHQIDGRGTTLGGDDVVNSGYPSGVIHYNRSGILRFANMYRVQANVKHSQFKIGIGGNSFSGNPVVKSEVSGTFISSSGSPNSGCQTMEAINDVDWSDPECRLMEGSCYPDGRAFGSEHHRPGGGTFGSAFGAENLMSEGKVLRMRYGGAGGVPWANKAGVALFENITWSSAGTNLYSTPSLREPVAVMINREDWTRVTTVPTQNKTWRWSNGVVTVYSTAASSTFRQSVIEYSRYTVEVGYAGWAYNPDGSFATFSGGTSGSKKDNQDPRKCLHGQNNFYIRDIGTLEHSRRFLAFEATPEYPDAVYNLSASSLWTQPDAANFPHRWQIALSTSVIGEYLTYNSTDALQFTVLGVKTDAKLRDTLSGYHVSSAADVVSPEQWNWTQTLAASGTDGGGGTLTIDVRYYDAWNTLKTPTRSGNNFVVDGRVVQVLACCYLLGNLSWHDIRCVNLQRGVDTVYESWRLGSWIQFCLRPEISATPRVCQVAGTQELYNWQEIHGGQWHNVWFRSVEQSSTNFFYTAGGGRFVMAATGIRCTPSVMTGNLRIDAAAYHNRFEGVTFTGKGRQVIWLDNANDATYGTTTNLTLGGAGDLAINAPQGSWIYASDPTRAYLTVNGTTIYNGTASAPQVFFWGDPEQIDIPFSAVDRPGSAPSSALVGRYALDGNKTNTEPNSLGYLNTAAGGSASYVSHTGVLSTNGFGQYLDTGPARLFGWGSLPDNYFSTTGITLSFLASIYTTIASLNVIATWRPAESEYIELRMSNATTLQLRVILGASNANASMSIYDTTLLDSKFHHFVMTFDATGRVGRLYIDSVLMLQTGAVGGTVNLGDMASTARRGFGFGSNYASDSGTCAKMSHIAILRGVYPPNPL